MTKINYQQIYEEEVSEHAKTSSEKPARFFELSHQDRTMVEDLVDAGYRRALEDNLDPGILAETAALAEEMSEQLRQFASMLQSYVSRQDPEDV